jgi:uncharacterized protein
MRAGCGGWKLFWVLMIGISVGTPAVAAQADAADKAHVWEGTLKIGSGAQVRLVFHVSASEAGVRTATFDSPDQGAKGLKVDAVTLDKTALSFDMSGLGMKYEGKLNPAGTESVGHWVQGGARLPLTLARKDKEMGGPAIVGPEQVWEGKLEVGAGLALRLVIHVGKTKDGTLVATMDSPDQGAKGLKVDTITLDKEKLALEMKALASKYEGKLDAKGDEAKGTWTQAGRKFPLNLKKVSKASEVRRPQTPKPPFPYKSTDVTYKNEAGKVSLAGTLTVPKGKGPFPAVILISGSGAQDRNETIFEHRPFAVLADALTKRGVAVLRVDDRGVGGTTGSTMKSTTQDLAGDVLAGVAFLKARSEINGRKIGLMGHSEGGIIAPLVASRSKDVAFIVLLAGTGLPGDEIINLQARAISLVMAEKSDEPKVLRQLELQKRLLQVIRNEPDDTKLDAKIKAMLAEFKAKASESERKELGDIDEAVGAQSKILHSPWFRFFLTYDPRPALAKVRCPVLVVIGEKDLQVPPKENLAEIGKALKQGGNSKATLKQLPGLNHLFQTCKTGAPAEYTQIEETIAPLALKEVGDWVVSQTAAK